MSTKRPEYKRLDPNVPNRLKSSHSRGAGNSEYVRMRHPEFHRRDAEGQPTALLDFPGYGDPEEGVVLKDSPCDPFSNTDCFLLDGFDRTLLGGSYSDGSSFASPDYYYAQKSGASDATGDGDNPFELVSDEGARDRDIDSYLGTAAHGWTSNPGLGCGGLDFTFTGWKEKTPWWKYTVPAHPADMAGITFGPITFVAPTGLAGGTVGQLEGAQVVVKSSEPTSVRDGTVVANLVNGVSTTVYIPGSSIPAEGGEFWIGVIPGWQANLGGYTCGFRWPWMDGKGNSAKAYYNETPVAIWQIWDAASEDWGYSNDANADGAFFDGNLPWVVAASGGTYGMDGGFAYLTAAAGSPQTLFLTMAGGADVDLPDDYDEPVGEPWTSDLGVRMRARFRLTTAGSLTETGTRYLSFRWQDGRNEYKAVVHLGDAGNAQGLTISDEVNSANVVKDITEGAFMWVSLDTRNPGYLRGKLWTEGSAYGSGEPAIWDVEATVEDTTEDGVTGNFFEIGISAGNATGADQTVEVDSVCFAQGADDCKWVQERIGQADGNKILFATSQASKEGSLWFFVDGLHVRTTVDDANKGTFRPVDNTSPDENAVLVARYRVDLNPDGD